MTTFATADRGRIVDALNLDEILNRSNSLLTTLMTERERDDTAYSVDRVGQIIEALDALELLDLDISAQAELTGIKRFNAENDTEVEFFNSSSSTQPAKQSKQKQIDNIKRWLDPDSRLEAYSLSGRVIRTL